MNELSCPVTDDAVESPGVGVFVQRGACVSPGMRCLGVLMRLHVPYALVVPESVTCRLCVPNGARLMAGDRLAERVCEAPSAPGAKDTAESLHAMTSPVDGFLVYCDASENPLLAPGDPMPPGCIVAFVELMKIRMEITYSEPVSGTFVRYVGSNRRAVRRGEIFAQYR